LESKVRGLLALYTGKEFSIKINDSTATVEIEPELTFNYRWLLSKRQIAREIISNTDIKEICYVEKYNKEVLSLNP